MDKLLQAEIDPNSLVDDYHSQLASEHSRNAIFYWYATSIIYIFIKGGLIGFFSWKTILFLMLSPFIASILSIPTFWLTEQIAYGLNNAKFPLWGVPIYQAFSFLYEPILAILVINFIGLP